VKGAVFRLSLAFVVNHMAQAGCMNVQPACENPVAPELRWMMGIESRR
jgi:hypothetical protein